MTEQRRCENHLDPIIGETHEYLGNSKHCTGIWVFVGWRLNTTGRTIVMVQPPNDTVIDRYQTSVRCKWITHMDILERDFPAMLTSLGRYA